MPTPRRWHGARSRPHLLFINRVGSIEHETIPDLWDQYRISHFGTLEATGWATSEEFNIFAHPHRTGRRWGSDLCAYLKAVRPDALMSGVLNWTDTPTLGDFVTVARWCRSTHTPIVIVWPDLVTDEQAETAERLLEHVDWHIQSDRPVAPARAVDASRYLPLWTPIDGRFFYASTEPKNIPLSFLGEKLDRPERQVMLQALVRAGLPLMESGGRASTEAHLSTIQYAAIQRRTQIGINITSHPTNPQLKGRLFELLACRTLLLEHENSAIQTYFEPDVDYVSFRTPAELVDKAHYYLAHPVERERIARQGHRAYRARYTLFHYWRKILDKLWEV